MSERLLEAFREEAEVVTRVPDFDLIQARGRTRRRRRYAVTGAVLGVCPDRRWPGRATGRGPLDAAARRGPGPVLVGDAVARAGDDHAAPRHVRGTVLGRVGKPPRATDTAARLERVAGSQPLRGHDHPGDRHQHGQRAPAVPGPTLVRRPPSDPGPVGRATRVHVGGRHRQGHRGHREGAHPRPRDADRAMVPTRRFAPATPPCTSGCVSVRTHRSVRATSSSRPRPAPSGSWARAAGTTPGSSTSTAALSSSGPPGPAALRPRRSRRSSGSSTASRSGERPGTSVG